MQLSEILAKARGEKELSVDEIKRLLLATDSEQSELFDAAGAVRDKHFGKRVIVRAVVEFSNYCTCNCLYCGMRCDNKSLERYRLFSEDIRQKATEAKELGIGSLFLQSGEDPEYPFDDLCEAIRWVASENGQTVILCIGLRKRQEYERLLAAGATKFVLKNETSNPVLFRKMKPGATLQNRLRHLRRLRDVGFKIGTGCIVGLPGQSVDDLAHDVMLVQKLRADMASASPFVPNDGSPLSSEIPGDLNLTLNVMAATRMVAPNIHMPSVSALNTLNPDGQVLGFEAGASVITINMTPGAYRDKYLLYKSGRALVTWDSAMRVIERAGLQMADHRE